MSTYALYQQARDAAWKTLLACECASLPVDVRKIANQLGVEVLPFPAAEEHLARLLSKVGGACCSLRIRGKWHIFLDAQKLGEREAGFAVAHEIGHVVLRHDTRALPLGIRAFRSAPCPGDVVEDTEDLLDYAADIFALRLLAPACVLHGLQLYREQEIADRCGLPPRAAALRAERMVLLSIRSAFFSHPLERQVYGRFIPYIEGLHPAPFVPAPKVSVTYPPLPPLRGGGGMTMEEYRAEYAILLKRMKITLPSEAGEGPPPRKRALCAKGPLPLRRRCLLAFFASSACVYLAFLLFL